MIQLLQRAMMLSIKTNDWYRTERGEVYEAVVRLNNIYEFSPYLKTKEDKNISPLQRPVG
jgi:hypothetical protein